ncbi:hypothetical protein DFH09DRAFT_1415969 [Mycena vulgaris]|nr:hypothetical protein DFH09DRAFT_1415969 [Mycena vulgaris]
MSSDILSDFEDQTLDPPRPGTTQLASFPPEILGEIFLASIPDLNRTSTADSPAHFEWTLSHVCRHWRASALAYPKLWSFLDIEERYENAERTSPTLDFIETCLQRSGKHRLTFRLTDAQVTADGHRFLECLLQYSSRWETVHFKSLQPPAIEILSKHNAGEFPSLRSLDVSLCNFNSNAVEAEIFHSIPSAQLQRYHEYDCFWYPGSARQWAIIEQLTNVHDFRAKFQGVSDSVIELPHLRFASIVVDDGSDDLTIEEVLQCFDLPRLEGLNLHLWTFHPEEVLCPMPGMLKALKILHLCGAVEISNESLTCILTEITTLTDFSVALTEFNAQHMFTLLTPDAAETVLVPNLQALRVLDFTCDAETLEVFLAMLQARFGGVAGAEFTPLRLFKLWLRKKPSSILDNLKALKEREDWDIRLDGNWTSTRDLRTEEMDEAYL